MFDAWYGIWDTFHGWHMVWYKLEVLMCMVYVHGKFAWLAYGMVYGTGTWLVHGWWYKLMYGTGLVHAWCTCYYIWLMHLFLHIFDALVMVHGWCTWWYRLWYRLMHGKSWYMVETHTLWWYVVMLDHAWLRHAFVGHIVQRCLWYMIQVKGSGWVSVIVAMAVTVSVIVTEEQKSHSLERWTP